jgi:hypothetical protein
VLALVEGDTRSDRPSAHVLETERSLVHPAMDPCSKPSLRQAHIALFEQKCHVSRVPVGSDG